MIFGIGDSSRPAARGALLAALVAAVLVMAGCQPRVSPALPPGAIPPRSGSPLDAWLWQHPAVAREIVWPSERGPVAWTSWDEGRRRALDQAFQAEAAALEGRGDPMGFPLHDPPDNLLGDRARATTLLRPDDAWRLYIAYVGHSLALELRRVVPWSITEDSQKALEALLDGRSMFAWRGDLGGYLLEPGRAGWVVPGPPALELGFLMREHILQPTRLATIEAMIGWSRRLRHVTGRLDLDNAEQVWGYHGLAPVSRVLAGTGPGGAHVTAGCWGTTGLFIAVLRSANIPVRLVSIRGQGRGACLHAVPYFVSEKLFLSHGDDPYDRLLPGRGDGAVPPGRLLVDEATWSAWFGNGVDPVLRCANIGRQVRELALETLPPDLVRAYCEDERSRVDRWSGHVAHALGVDQRGTPFTPERLSRDRLWERLGEKARRTGACRGPARRPTQPPDPFEPVTLGGT